jgi:hypothetical protein
MLNLRQYVSTMDKQVLDNALACIYNVATLRN